MATVKYFFDEETGYVDYGAVINRYLVTWLANKFLRGDVSRLVYSDNTSAFRKRTDSVVGTNGTITTGNLQLPFMNFTQTDGNIDDSNNWYHWRLDKVGVYTSELETKIKMTPITIPYECTFWCSSAKEMRYLANELYFTRFNHTDMSIPIEYSFLSDGIEKTFDIPLYAKANFDMQVDPNYEQNEWLEQNIKHSISMDFNINSWGIKLGDSSTIVSITEKTILRFKNNLNESQTAAWDKIVEIID